VITRGRLIVGGVVVVGFILIALAGRNPTTPLDPDSTGSDGAKALVLLLDELSGPVKVFDKVPDSSVDVAVLLSDRLDQSAADALGQWIEAGGVLVVADPGSPFVPQTSDIGIPSPFDSPDQSENPGIDRGNCDLAAADGFDGLRDVPRVVVERSVTFDPTNADASCFGDALGGYYVVMQEVGNGKIVAVGGASAFINANLDTADNAVLAAALIVSTPHSSIAVLRRSLGAPAVSGPSTSTPTRRERRVGDGSLGLFDLMPDYLRWVALDLAAAWLILVLAKARRLGSPVVEAQPVAIAGNELVRARGRLLRKVEKSATVAALVAGFRSDLAKGIGAPPDVSDERLAVLAAARCRFDPAAILDALATRTVHDDRALVDLTDRLDNIRNDVLNRKTTT